MARRHRTQLLLDPPQHESLVRIAERENRSVSDLVRQMVDWGLERLQADRERKLAALNDIETVRERLAAKYGPGPEHPLDEVRAERERDMERVLGLRPEA